MHTTKNSYLLKTIYGNYKIETPLVEILNSPTIQRLKKIRQRGASEYSDPYPTVISRYDHSIGVLALLIRYKADISTQIAGLLHDASHTVFSHVAEHLFKHKSFKSSYQDEIHEWFLKEQKMNVLLEKYGFSLQEILHKSGYHKMLEQDLPDICIDRLEYNISSALNISLIKQTDIKTILNNLKFENEKWFFHDPKIAKKFAFIPLHLTKNDWGSPFSLFSYKSLAKALNIAKEEKLINYDDIHFSTDDIIWNILEESKNKEILQFLDQVKNPKKYIEVSNQQNHDKILYGKFRGINPWIKTKEELLRLTEIDTEFKNEFEKVKKTIYSGWYIKYKKPID